MADTTWKYDLEIVRMDEREFAVWYPDANVGSCVAMGPTRDEALRNAATSLREIADCIERSEVNLSDSDERT
jgi:hypothetical protein